MRRGPCQDQTNGQMAEEGHLLQPPLGKLIKPSISTILPLSAVKGTQGLAALPKPGVNNLPCNELGREATTVTCCLPPACLGCQPPHPPAAGSEMAWTPSCPWGIPVSFTTHKEKEAEVHCGLRVAAWQTVCGAGDGV